MTKSRMAALGAVAAFALLLVGGAGPAAAQTEGTPLAKVVKMTGTAKNGKKFKGTYTIHASPPRAARSTPSARSRAGSRAATSQRNVFAPVSSPARVRGLAAPARADPPSPNACQILGLELGPIYLDLLGLRVGTSRSRR